MKGDPPVKAEMGPAIFSQDRTYRYVLTRIWDDTLPVVAWIGLNPSTADESRLDPTLRRVLRFSSDWGYGSFVMLNLFAVRTPEPRVMMLHDQPVGPDNDRHVLEQAKAAKLVIGAWGSTGAYRDRGREVARMLRREAVDLHHLKTTQAGHPCHPLYLSSTLTPQPFDVGAYLP